MTDKDAKPEERRKAVAELVCVTQDSVDVKALAERFGVTPKTIYGDLKSEQVAEYALDEVKSQMQGEGVAQAWAVLKRALINGGQRGERVAMWLLEKLEVFKGGSTEDLDKFRSWLNEPITDESTEVQSPGGDNGLDPGEAEQGPGE